MFVAVAREIVFAFEARPTSLVIGDVFSAVGSLRWVDTTLVTGLAAVTAAALSIMEVRRQIERSDAAVQRQIDHAAAMQSELRQSKRDAARVALPLALSQICDYATTCARETHDLLPHCKRERLPTTHELPKYPEIPQSVVDVLKEIVEHVEPQYRDVFAKLASTMQIQRARLRGGARDMAGGFGMGKEDILSHIVDALEVYARASALFDYARFEPGAVPEDIRPGATASAIHNVGIFSRFEQDIAEKAGRHDAYVLFGSD